MRRVSELTLKELQELTDEEAEKYVLYEAASLGIPLDDKPKEPEYAEVPEPTHVRYTSTALPSLLFQSMKDMDQMLDMASELGVEYHETNPDRIGRKVATGRYSYAAEHDIKRVLLRMQAEEEALSPLTRANEKKELEYKEAMEQYRSYLKQIADLREEVMKPVWKARRDKCTVEEAQVLYLRYLEIAGGNVRVAFNFFSYAYRDTYKADVWSRIVDVLFEKHNIPFAKEQAEEKAPKKGEEE